MPMKFAVFSIKDKQYSVWHETNNKWKPEWRPYQWNTDADFSDVSYILFQIQQDEQSCPFQCLSAEIIRYSYTNLSYTAEFCSMLL